MANADDKVLIVHWDQHQAEVMNRLYGYFTDSAFVDVTLWCLGRCFKAHRVLLTACSDYFERVLLEPSCSGGGRSVTVVLHGVEPGDVSGLLELMYRGEARVQSQHLPRFLEAARLLGVRLLRSAALRVQPGPTPADEQQELCSKFTSLNDEIHLPVRENDRIRPTTPPVRSIQEPENLTLPTEKKEYSVLQVESLGQSSYCTNRRLEGAGTLTPGSSQGFCLQRAQTSDATTLPVREDQTETTWSSCKASTPEAPVRYQLISNERRQLTPTVANGGHSDCDAVVPATKAAVNVGITTAGGTPSVWRLPPPIPQPQELPTECKSSDDSIQAAVKTLDWVSSHAAMWDSPKLVAKLTANTQDSHTYHGEKCSSVENEGNETYSPKHHVTVAETQSLQSSRDSAAQETQQGNATPLQVESATSSTTRSGSKAFSPVVLVMQNRDPKERNFPLPQTTLPLPPPVHLRTDSKAAVAPASHAAGVGSTLAVAHVNKEHLPMPTSNLTVQGWHQQAHGSAFTSVQSSEVPRAHHPLALTKTPPVLCPSVVASATSQSAPEESPHSDNRHQATQKNHNVKNETQLVRGESKNGSVSDHQSLEEQERNQRSQRNTCADCGKTFASPYSLKKHMRTHTGERRYLCALCGKLFSQERNFRYHMSLHSGSREFAASCPECGKTFNNRNYLSSHMKIHRNRREYACADCGRRFNQRVSISMHARIHSGYRPHRCALCDKAFSRKVLLTHHMRTHTGEKPFSCQVCDKQFSDRSNMLVHARSHFGIKPYSCPHCGHAFSQRSNLRSHMAVHKPRPEPAPAQASASTVGPPASQELTSQLQELRTTSVILRTAADTLNASPGAVDSRDIT